MSYSVRQSIQVENLLFIGHVVAKLGNKQKDKDVFTFILLG